jgi:hypothetical protein
MKTSNVLTAIVLAIIVATAITFLFGVSFIYPFAAMLFLSVIPTPRGVFKMALQVEIWQQDVIDNLYKNNQFAMYAVDADRYVLMGKVVHIPVAGAPGTIKKNLNVFPQTATKRSDTEVTYNIDTLYLLPRHIEDIEKYELSYDKRQSVVGEDQRKLIQDGMQNLLYRWAPAVANVILTEGADTAATLTGATGNRKKFTKKALEDIKLKMDAADIMPDGRVALLTAHHYNQFLASLSDAERTDVGRVADLKKGIVGEYLGFIIMMRSTVLRYRGADNAVAVVDELDEAYAADAEDRAASLVWHRDCVERALGSVKMFDNPNRAEYFGDIFSMSLRFGGRQRRATGVWAVVEALAA